MTPEQQETVWDKSELLEMHRKMALIRVFEERANEMYTKGKIGGFLHLYIGQEAVGVGFISALREDDYVIGAYREHGQCLARGSDPKHVMAELYGKATGVSKGKGGSMHMFDVPRGFMGGHGIVGGGIPLATGIGFAVKYREADQVCLCFFGDGAMNEGAFHESLNMASLWKLPVIFVLENNLYAMGTAVHRASSIPDLIRRVCCYDIKREQVDGMDLIAVRDLADRTISAVREDKEPRFIEAVTYRYRGHSISDPGKYRTKDEIEEWRKRDPIVRFEKHLRSENLATDEEIARIHDEVAAEIEEAIAFSEQSPYPADEELYTDIYV